MVQQFHEGFTLPVQQPLLVHHAALLDIATGWAMGLIEGYDSSTLNVLNVTVPTTGLTDQNFGETVGTLSGLVFRDVLGDGIFNGTDAGIGGVAIVQLMMVTR